MARFGYTAVALYLVAMAVVTTVYLATTHRRDLYREEVVSATATGVPVGG